MILTNDAKKYSEAGFSFSKNVEKNQVENELVSQNNSCAKNMVDNIEQGSHFENLLEPTISQILGKALKKGLGVTFKDVADTQAVERFSLAFEKMISNQENISKVDISQCKEHLIGLNINQKKKFDLIFPPHIAISCNDERTKVSLKVPAFHTEESINMPIGCTHFRFVNQIVTISDYKFNSLLNSFEPENVSYNAVSAITPSDLISVEEEILKSFDLTVQLHHIQNLPKNVSLLNIVGIHFYQDVGYGCYKFAGESSFKIRQVF